MNNQFSATLLCGILEGMDSIDGNCNDVIKLPCKATDRTQKYRYIMWYKKNSEKNLTAIIKKKNGNITHYNSYSNSASLREKETLELRGMNPLDSGVYKCYLAADVKGQNEESYIRLNISECVYLTTLQPSTVTASSCPDVAEFSVSWALLGFSLISMTKIILCIITVGVCDRVIFKNTKKTGSKGIRDKKGNKVELEKMRFTKSY